MSARCIACQCDEEARAPSTAFLAGIAFVGSFNAAGVRARLCDEHLARLERAWAGALPAVPTSARR